MDESSTRFITPHPRLRPYLSIYYFTSIDSRDGNLVKDWLNPEWASIRYRYAGDMIGAIGNEPMEPTPTTHFIGPTCRAVPFASRSSRVASIGFLPVGWGMFIAEPAKAWADRSDTAARIKSPVQFLEIEKALADAANPDAIAEIFDQMLLDHLDRSPLIDPETEARIRTAHLALLDPDVTTVAEFAERLEMSVPQLQRMAVRIFGFPPKLLLRRQRFLRTLAVVMREPDRNWTTALDSDYHDQAHFNRDFRQFFGMSPRAYRALPHPVIAAAAKARMEFLGDPLQGLQKPVA